MSLLDGKYDWIPLLQQRAAEYRKSDAEGAGFYAPRASVIKLCRISMASIEFIVACDELADDPSSKENRIHVVTLKKRLIDLLQH